MILDRLRGVKAPLVSPPQVWAVSHQSVQITWGWLPGGSTTVRCGDQSVTVTQPDGPGSVYIDGLDPGRSYEAELIPEGGQAVRPRRLQFRTPSKPPGQLLGRVATVSDMHLGSLRWGFLKTMREAAGTASLLSADGTASPPAIVPGRAPGPYDDPHPIRCARSALTDAVSWGADLLVVKGDSVQHETAGCYRLFGRLVDDFPMLPMMAIPGNHDVDADGQVIPPNVGGRELAICRGVEVQDLPGLRVVVADTAVPGRGTGTINRVASDVLNAVAEADRPVLLFTHHQFQPGKIARHWPIGITAPESTDFLDRLAALNKPVAASSGHTHRNRLRRHESILLTEVGSTKDWPCVWAGYNIFEGGFEQIVFRVSEQSAMAWAEYSQSAVGGLWSRWSPGLLDDRCVQHRWSAENRSLDRGGARSQTGQHSARYNSDNTA